MNPLPFKLDFGGRFDCAGFFHERKDCTVRATALVLGIPYADAHCRLAALGRKPGHGIAYRDKRTEKLGLEMVPQFAHRRLKNVLAELPAGRFAVRIRGHVFAVIDGVIHDSGLPKPGCIVQMVYTPKPS